MFKLYSLENCYWVTKMSLRRWSAAAKQSFERSAERCGINVVRDSSSESMHLLYVIHQFLTIVVAILHFLCLFFW